jgi:hypothetical protein
MAEGLIGALIGGVLALAGSVIVIALEQRGERERFWRDKEYEIYCLVVELLYALIEFVGDAQSPLDEINSVDLPSDEELWNNIVKLKRKVYPQLCLAFDKDLVDRVEKLYGDVSVGTHDRRFKTTTAELEAFIAEVRKKYFKA